MNNRASITLVHHPSRRSRGRASSRTCSRSWKTRSAAPFRLHPSWMTFFAAADRSSPRICTLTGRLACFRTDSIATMLCRRNGVSKARAIWTAVMANAREGPRGRFRRGDSRLWRRGRIRKGGRGQADSACWRAVPSTGAAQGPFTPRYARLPGSPQAVRVRRLISKISN